MATIRGNGPKGAETTWSVLFRHGVNPDTKKPRQRSVSFGVLSGRRSGQIGAKEFRSLVESIGADRALAALEEQKAEQGITVRELFDRWIEQKARDVTPRQAKDYRRDYENWVDPTFGHRAAAYIGETDVQAWVDDILRPQLSPKTVLDRHALLHGIYKWASAKKRGLVPHNPTLETDLPKRARKPPKGLTLPEYLALRDAAYRVNPEAADLIVFMANTGWRIGEATALMPLGVDDSGQHMYVSMTHVNRKGEGIVESAKSEASEGRRLRILPDGARVLRRRLVGLAPGDYVFTNSHSPTGLWEPSTFRNRWWKKSVIEAGLQSRNPTPHWLRHTHVLLCHMAGMSIAEIQRRIGHEDIKTTINVYGRMIDDMSDDVADRLDALLSGRGLPVIGEVVEPRELGDGT